MSCASPTKALFLHVELKSTNQTFKKHYEKDAIPIALHGLLSKFMQFPKLDRVTQTYYR